MSQEDQKNENNKQQEGLPDIADSRYKDSRLIIIVVILVGVIALILWTTHRHTDKTDNTNETFNIDGGAPPLKVTNTNSQQTATPPPVTNQPPITTSDLQKALAARISSPMMLVGSNDQQNNVNSAQTNNSQNNPQIVDSNTQFANQVSNQDVETAQATILQHRDELIAQGNLIHAVLETAINSDLPGYLRAIVSEPVYSEDGSQVLIPPGSRLIGQYKSGMLTGQSRIFVVWTRVIEPNGISVQLGSPGVDSLGVAGQAADEIDYHFWQMFGTASLLSVLGAGASNVGVSSGDQYNASQAYREAVSTSLAQSAQNSLQQNTMIPPTLHINQGTAIMVFVARDLRFEQTYFHTQQSIQIYNR